MNDNGHVVCSELGKIGAGTGLQHRGKGWFDGCGRDRVFPSGRYWVRVIASGKLLKYSMQNQHLPLISTKVYRSTNWGPFHPIKLLGTHSPVPSTLKFTPLSRRWHYTANLTVSNISTRHTANILNKFVFPCFTCDDVLWDIVTVYAAFSRYSLSSVHCQ